MSRRAHACAVAAAALAFAMAGCGEPPGEDSAHLASAGLSTVTFRLWDEAAADAYRESFDAFNAIHPGVHVDVEVVPHDAYAEAAASDLAAGTMADIFWTTSEDVAAEAGSGHLLPLGEVIGEDQETWAPELAEPYAADGELWAVPQLWDATVLFYNTELVERSGVDPAALTWDPAAVEEDVLVATSAPASSSEPAPETAQETAPTDDTLRAAVRALTRDSSGRSATEEGFDPAAVAEYGYNTDLTSPAVWLPFLAQLGARSEGPQDLVLDGPAGRATFSYLAALPDEGARAADVTARQLFTGGRLALYQSTSADLPHLQSHAQAEWGLAPVPAGPEGAATVVDGVGAAANAASEQPEATAQVLQWLASSNGQSALAGHGVGIPAAAGAQDLYREAWALRGVDVSAALDVPAVSAPTGPRVADALEAVRPLLARLFRGEIPTQEALTAAQTTALAILSP
ncbi:extracellular solute-binding protein [Georgenia sp. 311]|uniref:Extracellular solute-binding protein n=1 Tax=Georgenia wutianyii TaxID=2585135 RepID=A0ABX5VI77_9MICO|nr:MULTISPECIES: extracellular solute-binding protein [Georgenia]QDB78002.1 extracellular solute-binding protein [Georgenia wutianyii]TNC17934.1 extracellular solute-binding protein [Georgenia sp. 311]